MTDDNRREFYRIEYPRADQPTLRVDGRRYRVHDCSERGLRFAVPAHAAFARGAGVHGLLRFRRGAETEVDGTVVWTSPDAVALQLDGSGIPFALILFEQRRLYAKAH